MITPPMGSQPLVQLRRRASQNQLKAIDILRQLRASTRPPPQLLPHEDEIPEIVIPPKKEEPEK